MEKLPDLGSITRTAIIFMVTTAIGDPTTKKPCGLLCTMLNYGKLFKGIFQKYFNFPGN